jgi:superfamily II DNA helicase RecQ
VLSFNRQPKHRPPRKMPSPTSPSRHTTHIHSPTGSAGSGSVSTNRQKLHPELYPAFFRLFDATEDYKSKFQRDGCALVLANTDSVFLVGPTSADKSLFWLLPAVTESEPQAVTVVIVPLHCLLDDFLDKALAHGIQASRRSAHVNARCRLVFAAGETATPAIPELAHLARHPAQTCLVEEAHLTLTAAYRPQRRSLARLRAVAVPFVIITATAPPLLREDLLDNFQTRQPVLHASPTNRSEIPYSVSHDTVRDMPHAVRAFLASLWAKLSGKARSWSSASRFPWSSS